LVTIIGTSGRPVVTKRAKSRNPEGTRTQVAASHF
jgi:hypothetical protein